MAVEMTIHVIVPVVIGLIIGVLEAYFVYEDENMTSGRQFIGDMWHGLLFSVAGVLVASNVPWIFAQGWLDFAEGLLMVDDQGRSLIVCIAITLFMMVKMVSSHAIRGVSGLGFREKMWHKLVVAIAIGFAPYYMTFIYQAGWFVSLEGLLPGIPF